MTMAMNVYEKGDVVIRPTSFEDIDMWSGELMRPLEVAEVWASDHLHPREAVLASWVRSIATYTILHKGKLVGMFGIVPDSLLGERAMVWLLTTEEINNMRTRFLKLTRSVIDKLRQAYPVLYNWVDARNIQCVRWLKWAGAEVFAPEDHGADKIPFHYFLIGGR